MKFDPHNLSRRDKRILKALLYFYPRRKSAAAIYSYISKYSQKNAVKNAKSLGHILMRFPVDSELTVMSTATSARITNSRYIRLYALKDSFVKKYYKEKNKNLDLGVPKKKRASKKGKPKNARKSKSKKRKT